MKRCSLYKNVPLTVTPNACEENEMKQPNPKVAKQYQHKKTKQKVKIAPWWECPDPILQDTTEGKMDGRKWKIGTLVQVGWLIENENDVYFGVGLKAIEHFEVVK